MAKHVPMIIALLAMVTAPRAQAEGISTDRVAWNAPQAPFRIYGNTWYVGPHGLSSILIDTGHGLALLDGDLPESAPRIETNIRALGFRVRDVRWILNSHAHIDHAGGIAALQRASGARVLASEAGAHEIELGGADRTDPLYGSVPYYTPVKHVSVVRDGEALHLGNVVITAHYTPGHTPGSTTWTWISCEGTRCLHMVYADSLTAVSAPAYRFDDHKQYLASFRRSIALVAALPCDILLTPHPGASDFWARVSRRKSAGDAGPLIDPEACRRYAAAATEELDARLAQERTAAEKLTRSHRLGRINALPCGKVRQNIYIVGMAKSIRVSEQLYQLADRASADACRSRAQQIEYWAELGRAIEAAGITTAQIQRILAGDVRIRERAMLKLGLASPESMYLFSRTLAEGAKVRFPELEKKRVT